MLAIIIDLIPNYTSVTRLSSPHVIGAPEETAFVSGRLISHQTHCGMFFPNQASEVNFHNAKLKICNMETYIYTYTQLTAALL